MALATHRRQGARLRDATSRGMPGPRAPPKGAHCCRRRPIRASLHLATTVGAAAAAAAAGGVSSRISSREHKAACSRDVEQRARRAARAPRAAADAPLSPRGSNSYRSVGANTCTADEAVGGVAAAPPPCALPSSAAPAGSPKRNRPAAGSNATSAAARVCCSAASAAGPEGGSAAAATAAAAATGLVLPSGSSKALSCAWSCGARCAGTRSKHLSMYWSHCCSRSVATYWVGLRGAAPAAESVGATAAARVVAASTAAQSEAAVAAMRSARAASLTECQSSSKQRL